MCWYFKTDGINDKFNQSCCPLPLWPSKVKNTSHRVLNFYSLTRRWAGLCMCIVYTCTAAPCWIPHTTKNNDCCSKHRQNSAISEFQSTQACIFLESMELRCILDPVFNVLADASCRAAFSTLRSATHQQNNTFFRFQIIYMVWIWYPFIRIHEYQILNHEINFPCEIEK